MSTRLKVVIGVVALAVAGVGISMLPPSGKGVADPGGRPPPRDLAPPFPDASPSALKTLSLRAGDPCNLLNLERARRILEAPIARGSGPACVYDASGVRLEVEVSDSDHYSAFADEAASWPAGGQVVSDPAYALLLFDAERSALVADTGSGALILRLTDARLDDRDHQSRLVRLMQLAASAP